MFEHLIAVLDFDLTVETGRSNRRIWRIGNGHIDQANKILTGRIGFTRVDEQVTGVYREDEHIWEDVAEEHDRGISAPFAFDGITRILAVVRHPQFAETTIATVFTDFLTQGENALDAPVTDWSVEPILDERGFYEWLDATPVVERVSFVATLPNPDGLDGLEFVNRRMDRLEAGKINENITARDPEVGLRNVKEDEIARGYVESAAQGFGYVTGAGHNAQGGTAFDQRRKVARTSVEIMPGSWAELLVVTVSALRVWRRRRNGPDAS